jgi:hypothetical protein
MTPLQSLAEHAEVAGKDQMAVVPTDDLRAILERFRTGPWIVDSPVGEIPVAEIVMVSPGKFQISIFFEKK